MALKITYIYFYLKKSALPYTVPVEDQYDELKSPHIVAYCCYNVIQLKILKLYVTTIKTKVSQFLAASIYLMRVVKTYCSVRIVSKRTISTIAGKLTVTRCAVI